MAIVLPPKARKTRVRKNTANDGPTVTCVVCGNGKPEDLSNGFRDHDGVFHRVIVCKYRGTCANMVSTFMQG